MSYLDALRGGKAPAQVTRDEDLTLGSRDGGASASASQGWKIVELKFENEKLKSKLKKSKARTKIVEAQLEQYKAQLEAERWKLAVRTQQYKDSSAKLQTIGKLKPIENRVVCITAKGGEMCFMLTEKIAREAIRFQAFQAWDFNYSLPVYELIFYPAQGNVKVYSHHDILGKYYVFQIGGQPQKMKIVEIDYLVNFNLKCIDENGDDMIIPLSEARFKEF